MAEELGREIWQISRVRAVSGGKLWRFDLYPGMYACTCYGEHEYQEDPLDGPCLVPVDHIVADSKGELMQEIVRLITFYSKAERLAEQAAEPVYDGSERSFEDRIRWTE